MTILSLYLEAPGLLFTFAMLALAFLIFGEVTKLKVFNLFSVGFFVFLMVETSAFPALVVTHIGLIVFILVITFFGSSRGS
jgi:hypothetical protein